MEVWHAWLIFGVLCLLVELFTFTLVLAAVTLGALVAASAAYWQLSLSWQLLGLGVGTLAGFLGARPLVLKRLGRGDRTYRSNLDGLVGQEGTVLEALSNRSPGRVLLVGEDWSAISDTSGPISEGRLVTVVEVRGNRLVVVKSPNVDGG
ncbi:MAG: NfeD family protein [Gemmatimonadetes bacterium]|nr:NfeD family protein [Gemmatimonadota bacterium]